MKLLNTQGLNDLQSHPLFKFEQFATTNESTKIMRLRLLFPALIALVLLFAACAPAPELRNDKLLHDTSFIDGDPCGAPCWRGITPGETSWQDALTLIEDDSTLTDPDLRTSDDSDIQGALWGEDGGDDCCQMYTEDGETVDVLILQTAPDVTLGEVIDEHSDPEYIIGEEFTDDQGVVSLFYPEQQMVIYVFTEGADTSLTEDSEVIGFGYFSSSRMEVLLLTNELHAWEGYDTITNYMTGELEVTPSITLTPTTEPEDE